ncbi:MAG: sulfatase-like hydrolase/transferase [Armatimonadetes bacterium]|nr:sulfatase-like hydrolase/transferase [Armatimonadota bacterium]
MSDHPNIVVIMTDQQRADVCAREGFPLDTTPFLDSLARQGTWFNRAYTSMPVCGPARVSFLTGRYPSAHRVRVNHHTQYASYKEDLIDVMRKKGYATAMVGKNHSHLIENRVNHWFWLMHKGGKDDDRTDKEKAFDAYLGQLNHGTALDPTPFPVECQCPHRAVTNAQEWIRTLRGQPFFLWLSFPEPHNPFQVPEPYFSMFPPESLPPLNSGRDALDRKGFKWQFCRKLGEYILPDYEALIPRTRANYFGMLRLIDDQVKRFVQFLEAEGLRDNTLVAFLSDHGDFVGEYGLIRKGPGLPEVLTRIPMQFTGPGIAARPDPHGAHVSIVDLMPTLCEAIGAAIPPGVQGRSLCPLLTGQRTAEEGFSSAYAEHGFGGLNYDWDDRPDFSHCLIPGPDGPTFDCLNSYTQSGTMRMVRKDDWKLILDPYGSGEMYHLSDDPFELENLFADTAYREVRNALVEELLRWSLRVQDTFPHPEGKYRLKEPSNA